MPVLIWSYDSTDRQVRTFHIKDPELQGREQGSQWSQLLTLLNIGFQMYLPSILSGTELCCFYLSLKKTWAGGGGLAICIPGLPWSASLDILLCLSKSTVC